MEAKRAIANQIAGEHELMKKVVAGGSNSVQLASSIAKKLGVQFTPLKVLKFPDKSLYVRFLVPVKNAEVILVQSMHAHASQALVEILFACYTARRLGAKKVTLVCPYLAFMRQDKEFRPGECISAQVMAKLISSCCDKLVTIDAHLHRIHDLQDIFGIPTQHLTSNNLIAEYAHKHWKNAVIIGPDGESNQWAEAIAQKLHSSVTVLKKKRYSSETVRIKLKTTLDLRGKTVILVDDIISTGHTLLEPIKQIKQHKPKKIICIGVHGILAENALEKLQKTGAEVVTTNTITNPVAKIDVSELLAAELRVLQ